LSDSEFAGKVTQEQEAALFTLTWSARTGTHGQEMLLLCIQPGVQMSVRAGTCMLQLGVKVGRSAYWKGSWKPRDTLPEHTVLQNGEACTVIWLDTSRL